MSHIISIRKKPKYIKKWLPAMICQEFDSQTLYIHTIKKPIYTQIATKTMDEIEIRESDQVDFSYRAPKRYETTCYFKPLAVPVWYSTSIMIKINSTKKRHTESVTYKKKLVPFRFVEKMTTMTPNTQQPALFISNINIHRNVPTEHYINLEPQQKAALDKPFTSDHAVAIEQYT